MGIPLVNVGGHMHGTNDVVGVAMVILPRCTHIIQVFITGVFTQKFDGPYINFRGFANDYCRG